MILASTQLRYRYTVAWPSSALTLTLFIATYMYDCYITWHLKAYMYMKKKKKKKLKQLSKEVFSGE